MGILNKKWFALGLTGTLIAVGGVICIAFGMLFRMTTIRMINMSIGSMLSMYYFFSGYGSGMGSTIWLTLIELNRYNKMLTIFTIPLYIGIGSCIVGGILALVGWINYIQLNQRKM